MASAPPPETLKALLEASCARWRARHVITTQAGDAFPAPKRWAVNFAVKHVKRMVPAWRIPGAIAFNDARAPELPATSVRPEDVAFLQYTGGTTGRPKGAALTHANMAANVRQTLAWARAVLKEGEETVVTALPLYHIFALTANLLLFFRLGGRNLLIPNPRDLPAFVAALERHRFSAITGVKDAGGSRPTSARRASSSGSRCPSRPWARCCTASSGRAPERGLQDVAR